MKPMRAALPVLMMVALMMPCVWAGPAATPDDLFQAASRGDQRTIERVTKAGVSVNAHDAQGRSAVHHAAASGQTRLLPVLYRKGLSLNEPDYQGQTPLHLAVKFNHNETADYLVQRGASSTTPDNEGKTPLDLAIESGSKATRDALLHPGRYYQGDQNARVKAATVHRPPNPRPRTVHNHPSSTWFGLFAVPFPVLLVIGVALLVAFKRRSRRERMCGRRTAPATDEAAILKRIWEGLDRMERRADNLETILLPPEKGPTRG